MNKIPLSVQQKAARTSVSGLLYLTSNGNFKPYPHIQRISEALKRVTLGETKRLMINVPPQHGKSETAFRTYPAWHLSKKPNDKIICASYGEDLSRKAGFSNRNIINGYGGVLSSEECPGGISIEHGSGKVTDWTLKGFRGGVRSVGVGSGLTGHPADLIIIDDPFKGFEEAINERNRDAVWDWYTTVALTRLSKRGRIVIIQTRWHEDDLSGRLLKKEADDWEVISLPAIADELGNPADVGVALCEELHPLEKLQRDREVMGEHKWSCLYQQIPSMEGEMEWPSEYFAEETILHHEPSWPHGVVLPVMAWDTASGKEHGDYQCFFLLGIHQETKQIYGEPLLFKESLSISRNDLIEWIKEPSANRPVPHIISIEDVWMYVKDSPGDISLSDNAKLLQKMVEFNGWHETQVNLNVPTPPGMKKLLRVKFGLDELFRNKLIKLIPSKSTSTLLYQLRNLGNEGVNDDGPDGLEIARREWNRVFGAYL